jgi:hypothetical protein
MISEQRIKALVDPSDTEMEQMIKARFTPAHSGSLKPLGD